MAAALYTLVQTAHLLWTTRHFGVRGDELITLDWARLPLGQVVEVTGADIHPPLYFLVLHVALAAPLDEVVTGRLLALGMAAGFLCLVPAIGRALGFAPRVRGAAFVLTAMSPLLWQHAVTIRPYTMAALLFAVCVLAAVGATRSGGLRPRAALAAGLVLLVYTNYLSALCAVLVVNVLFLTEPRRMDVRRWVGTQFACLPFLLPLVSLAVTQVRKASGISTSEGIASSGLTGMAARLAYWCYGMVTGETLLAPLPLAVLAAVLAVAAVHAARARRRVPAEEQRAVRGALTAAGVVVTAYVVTASLVFRGELFTAGPARTLAAVPFVTLALAHALVGVARTRPRTGAALVAAIGACWIWAAVNECAGHDYFKTTESVPRAEIARAVRDGAGPGRRVLVDAPFGNDIVYALRREGVAAENVWSPDPDSYRRREVALRPEERRGLVLVRYNRDLTGGGSTWFVRRLAVTVPGMTEAGSYGPTPSVVRWLGDLAGRQAPPYQVGVYRPGRD